VSGHEFTHAVQRKEKNNSLLPQAPRATKWSDTKEAAAQRSDIKEAQAQRNDKRTPCSTAWIRSLRSFAPLAV